MNCQPLVALLIKNKLTLSVAESCTGGLICHSLTLIPGVSNVFKEGMVCYSNTSKTKRLNIPARSITKHGAVSAEICGLMARNITKSEKTHLGLATTGIAGPSGAALSKPVGLVYIGLNILGRISVSKFIFKGRRNEIQILAARKALSLLEQAVKTYAG